MFIVLLLFIIRYIRWRNFDGELGRFVGKSWGMAHGQHTSAVRALQLELKKMNDEPVEGFQVRLGNDDNIFEWQVAIFGPPSTLYEGGYFKVTVIFWLTSYFMWGHIKCEVRKCEVVTQHKIRNKNAKPFST